MSARERAFGVHVRESRCPPLQSDAIVLVGFDAGDAPRCRTPFRGSELEPSFPTAISAVTCHDAGKEHPSRIGDRVWESHDQLSHRGLLWLSRASWQTQDESRPIDEKSPQQTMRRPL